MNTMKKVYKDALLLALAIIVSFNLMAQERIVVVPPYIDNNLPLNEFILGDTTASGAFVDSNNTVYELENGGFYYVSNQIEIKGIKLHIRGQEGDGHKPKIYQKVKDDGKYPGLLYVRGETIVENVLFNAKENELKYDWGPIRTKADSVEVTFKNVTFEQMGGGCVAVYSIGNTITLDGCVGKLLGNPLKYNGNGSVIDGRNETAKVVIKNSVFFNINGTINSTWQKQHGYWEFDHNTFVNVSGHPRMFQFSKYVDTVKITNNIFANCLFSGDYPTKLLDDKEFDAKHSQYGGDTDGTMAFFMCYDSLPVDQNKWKISNNNVFYTQDVLDDIEAYSVDPNDTVSLARVMSPNFEGWYSASDDVYFEEVLNFGTYFKPPTFFSANWYADPSAEITVQCHPVYPEIAGDSIDYYFDHDVFDFSYLETDISATAGTDGGPIGSPMFPPRQGSSIKDRNVNSLDVTPYPNPANDQITFKFNDSNSRNGNVTIYSLTGSELRSKEIINSDSKVTIDLSDFENGIYLYSIVTEEGRKAGKFVVE